MLVSPYHVQQLIDLAALARNRPAAELTTRTDAVRTFLAGLWSGASKSARDAFQVRLERLPATERIWGAVRVPTPGARLALQGEFGAAAPPALQLVLGQVADAADTDANQIPDRGTATAAAWESLYAALDRWDVLQIRGHIGPFGWRPGPILSRSHDFAVEVMPRAATATLSPTAPDIAPPPTTPSGKPTPAPSPAGFELDAELLLGAAAVATTGAALFTLYRSLRVPTRAGLKEPQS